MYRARQRQLRREEVFESTLRGDIERALAQTEFQTTTARNIVWWGLIPLWLAGALWVLTVCHLVAAPPRAYLLMGATMAIALVVVVWGRQRAITFRYEPRRRELESLRSKLAEPRP
jgi:cytochrome bd-type quinol oxidase subunit 2